MCSLHLPGRSTQGNYVIIQSLGTTKQGRNYVHKIRNTQVFLTLQYMGKLLGPKFFDGLGKNP